jgi:hypothetical protein
MLAICWSASTISLITFLINHVLVPMYSVTVLLYFFYSWYKHLTQSRKSETITPPTNDDTCCSIVSDLSINNNNVSNDMKINLSGTFKLIKHEGFDSFLAANGVPYLLRKAALSTQPVHTITHNGDTVRVQISGIINGDITYHVNGPCVESTIHTRRFEDHVTYLDEGDGIRITKKAIDSSGGAREIVVTRRLIDDHKNMLLTSTSFFDDDRPSIQYTQLLERQS